MNAILIRGGGDLASGIALRLSRAGLAVIIAELAQPLAVRRTVSFAEAVYEGSLTVEGVTARRADPAEAAALLAAGEIPVLIDPDLAADYPAAGIHVRARVDARMMKAPQPPLAPHAPFTVGLGPGFIPGINCHAVVETKRGHTLGRVYRLHEALADTGLPDGDPARVLYAPETGTLAARAEIGETLARGQLIAEIQPAAGGSALPVRAPFDGILRGLIHPGLRVRAGMKIGDVDARGDAAACRLVSDKALALGGGVLEALLTRPDLRARLWN
jgi:xanthine dehydrogenase accessory factor